MSWILIAAIPPALWGITNLIEDFFIDRYLKKKSIELVLIFSALPGLIFLPAIFIFRPSVVALPFSEGFLMILNGVLSCLALVPYYLSLKRSDASSVVPVFQSIPVFGFVLGFVFLGESVSSVKLLGSFLVILGGIGISFHSEKRKKKFDSVSLLLMLLSSCLIALSSLIFKFFALSNDFLTVVFWDLLGTMILGSIFFLFFDPFRSQFLSLFKKQRGVVMLLSFSNESLGMVAEITMNLAITMVPVGLAWSFNGLQPLFVLVYSCFLTLVSPKLFKENLHLSALGRKISFIASTAVGVYLIVK